VIVEQDRNREINLNLLRIQYLDKATETYRILDFEIYYFPKYKLKIEKLFTRVQVY